jgi:hypothetical protein
MILVSQACVTEANRGGSPESWTSPWSTISGSAITKATSWMIQDTWAVVPDLCQEEHRETQSRTVRADSAYIVSERPPDSASTARRRSLWVSRDTTMRHRPQPRTSSKTCGDAPSLLTPDRAATVARIFSPSELDLDDLAEAIRSLLGPSIVPQIESPGRPAPDLLPARPRVTHVVEATQTP